jgi:hypothetical protein
MTRDDMKHSSERVGDEQTAPRQAAPPALPVPEEPPSASLRPRRERPKPTPNPDADHVLQLCRDGRLFELQQWIAAGRSIVMPSDYRKSPLGIAVQTGFHSLIELLLQHESGQAAKDAVLIEACQERHVGVVELALQYGADPRGVAFLDALLAWDRRVVSALLERGADVVTDYPFARAFQMRIRTALGCYLDCRRQRPDVAGALPMSIASYLAQYDRRHLYKQVWSAPMPKIAKHYGVTEMEIAKACRHLNVPTPPQGYWSEKDAGLPVSAAPMLPPLLGSLPKHQTDERSS